MAVTRVEHIPTPATVPVSPAAGQFLFFRVDAGGPVPRFQFVSDIKGVMLNQGMFPSDPAPFYEWTYLRDPSDIQQFEQLSVSLLFAGNSAYRYRLFIKDSTGLTRPVIDIDYSGGGPTDFDTEVFRVLIV